MKLDGIRTFMGIVLTINKAKLIRRLPKGRVESTVGNHKYLLYQCLLQMSQAFLYLGAEEYLIYLPSFSSHFHLFCVFLTHSAMAEGL